MICIFETNHLNLYFQAVCNYTVVKIEKMVINRDFSVEVGVVPIQRIASEGHHTRSNLDVDFVCNEGSHFYIQSV